MEKREEKWGDWMGLDAFLRLTEEQQTLYRILWTGMGNRRIFCKAPVEDIGAVLKAVLMDHPELCFFEGKWGYENGVIYPHYCLFPATREELLDRAKALSARFPEEDYPRLVYAWMISRIAYDPASPNSQNAYGALVQRRAVCKGIAKAYQLMMQQRKIRCILVEGTLDGRTKHVWNLIFCKGQWRHVDVTMGYPMFRCLVGAEDEWGGYLLTTEAISRSHGIRNAEALPKDGKEAQYGTETM